MKKMSGWEGLEASCPNILGPKVHFIGSTKCTLLAPQQKSVSAGPTASVLFLVLHPFKPELQSQEQQRFQGDEIISCVWPE